MFEHKKPQHERQFKEAPRLEIILDEAKSTACTLPSSGNPGRSNVYTTGSTISGHLIFRHPDTTDFMPQASTVTLHGHSKTLLKQSNGNNGTSTYRGRTPLLCINHVLNATETYKTHEDGHGMTISFSLTVPATCTIEGRFPPQSSRVDYFHDFKPNGIYASTMAGTPLPPSFGHNSYHFEGKVVYSLTARIILRMQPEISAITPIALTPSRPPLETLPQPKRRTNSLQIRTLRLLPENVDRKLTFKEKIGGVFKSGDLPRVNFVATVTLPCVVILGTRPRLDLQLNFNSSVSTAEVGTFDPTSAPIPERVQLKSCLLEIKAHTEGRAPRTFSEIYKHSSDVVFSCVGKSAEGDFLTEKNGYELQCETVRPANFFGPGFTTCNLKRIYVLKVSWTLECAGETMSVVHKDLPLLVYSGRSAETRTKMVARSPQPAMSMSGTTLAPYSDYAGEAGPSTFQDPRFSSSVDGTTLALYTDHAGEAGPASSTLRDSRFASKIDGTTFALHTDQAGEAGLSTLPPYAERPDSVALPDYKEIMKA